MALAEVRVLLARLGHELADSIVLVGGQALAHWESFLFPAADNPITSKDIDFVGTRRHVQACALRLGGTARLAGMDDATPNVGVVRFVDDGGIDRDIDFLAGCFGVDDAQLLRTAVPFQFEDDDGPPARLRVMHPVLCLQSRVANTMGLPGYDSPHGLRQVAVALRCAKTFLGHVLLPGAGARPVLDWNEALFRFVTRDRYGRRAALRYPDLDPFEAVCIDPRLPTAFLERRYPQMVVEVNAYRDRHRGTGAE
jgi:hypothetical protein